MQLLFTKLRVHFKKYNIKNRNVYNFTFHISKRKIRQIKINILKFNI